MTESSKLRATIFLDRDGTLNVEKNYLYRYEDWEWLPGAVEAIKTFNDKGFLVIVVSNQAGIARGLFFDSDVQKLHNSIDDELIKKGAKIDGFYYCPHHPEFGDKTICNCRKPSPGLLIKAKNDWDIDLKRSFMIGDKVIDMNAGKTAGVRSILVTTGHGSSEQYLVDAETPIMTSLLSASLFIERLHGSIQWNK